MNKPSFNDEENKLIFEQYKLYVEMADRISQRRMNANTFFISVNTLLFAVASYLGETATLWNLAIGVLGCILCFAWYFTLNSYRQLNSGKFKVIHEIEKLLPLSGYEYEWDILKNGENKKKYWPLSHVEKIVPIVFFISYMVYIIYHFAEVFCG
jgi:hypothetical protein